MSFATSLSLVLVASGPQAQAGESLSAYQKLTRSTLVIELMLPVQGAIPAEWPNQGYDPVGWAFPDTIVASALQAATVERILVGAGGLGKLPVPEHPHIFGSASACWWLAHQRGSVRSLLFLERGGEAGWRQVLGVEQEWGGYSDLNSDYDALVAAIARASAWTDERPHAVSDQAMWQDQRAALAGDDPYLLVLARDFLLAHDAAAVVDEVWGAPGTPERAVRALSAVWPTDPGRCVAALTEG
jgi:hypothetical protein